MTEREYHEDMELTIEGHPSFHVEGTVTVELPDYMQLLEPSELEEARTAANRNGLILAAGRHKDGNIVFLTGAGELMEFDWDESSLPRLGRAFPIDYGQTLRIEVNNQRAIETSALWARENARLIIFLGAMAEPDGARVSYT